MNVHRVPLQQRRFDHVVLRRAVGRRLRDPIAAPRALALGLLLAIIIWLAIAALLGAF